MVRLKEEFAMQLGIISDTHGGLKSWREIVTGIFSQVDFILHAGDIFYHGIRNPQPEGYDTINLAQEINQLKIPLLVCRGNCDSEVDQLMVDIPIQSPYVFCQLEGLKILLHHGHRLNDEEVLRLASHWDFGISISGHTHIPRLEQKGQVVFLNPGSHSLPKGEVPTVGLIENFPDIKEVVISIIDYQRGEKIKNLVIKTS